MKPAILAVMAVAVMLSARASAQQNLQRVVDSLFPQSLNAALSESGLTPDRRSCYVVYDTLAGQAQTIIAGYSNQGLGTLRVISHQPNVGYTAYRDLSSDLAPSGGNCQIELLDLDGDGQAEIHATFDGEDDWIFRWDGNTLTNLTPTQVLPHTSSRASRLVDISWYDPTHSGPLSLLARGPEQTSTNGDVDEVLWVVVEPSPESQMRVLR